MFALVRRPVGLLVAILAVLVAHGGAFVEGQRWFG